jgi:hypothetical protein
VAADSEARVAVLLVRESRSRPLLRHRTRDAGIILNSLRIGPLQVYAKKYEQTRFKGISISKHQLFHLITGKKPIMIGWRSVMISLCKDSSLVEGIRP